MRWQCDECKRMLGRLVRIAGQKPKDAWVALCPICKKNTSQHATER